MDLVFIVFFMCTDEAIYLLGRSFSDMGVDLHYSIHTTSCPWLEGTGVIILCDVRVCSSTE